MHPIDLPFARSRRLSVALLALGACADVASSEPESGLEAVSDTDVAVAEHALVAGTTANAVASCMNDNSRIGAKPTRSIYNPSGYVGWAEWRIGNSGECRGWQWVRVHITVPIAPLDIFYYVRGQPIESNYVGHFFWSNGLGVGQHEGPIVRDDRVICGLLNPVASRVPSGLGGVTLFFGVDGTPVGSPVRSGMMC